jgi:hypothetical protein
MVGKKQKNDGLLEKKQNLGNNKHPYLFLEGISLYESKNKYDTEC